MIEDRRYTLEAYLKAVEGGEKIATIDVGLAAQAVGIQRNTMVRNMRAGKLPLIFIDDEPFVSAKWVHDLLALRAHKVSIITPRIEEAARQGETVFYKELMEMVGLDHTYGTDRNEIGRLLATVSITSYDKNRIFLSSIVHRTGTTTPGDGYLNLIKSLAEDRPAIRFDPDGDHDSMISRHMKAVYKHYAQ